MSHCQNCSRFLQDEHYPECPDCGEKNLKYQKPEPSEIAEKQKNSPSLRVKIIRSSLLILIVSGLLLSITMKRLCIAEGTLIATPSGEIPIEKLKIGDLVWSYDIQKQKRVATQISNIKKTKASKTLLINQTLRVTNQHPLFTKQGWKEASELTTIDSLFNYQLKWKKELQIHSIEEPIYVYDLSVGTPHNFFAGNFLVHNKTINHLETRAIGNLRSLSTAQSQFQNTGLKDRDSNGVGEYGYFVELAGIVPIPEGTSLKKPAKPLFISKEFGKTSAANNGIATRSGYHFILFLPTKDKAIGEKGKVVPPSSFPLKKEQALEIEEQEKRWCAYAWPVNPKEGYSGKAFFINQDGEVIATSNIPKGKSEFFYSGLIRIPKATDIFAQDGTGNLDGTILTGEPDANGLIWNPTN